MARTTRWRSVAGVLALSGGAYLATGSAGPPGPDPTAQGVQLRLVVDECPGHAAAAAKP
ncbi:hypothetical protein [Spongiactinospora sp. TRM90649]|uniref:hypothetical protein n=1 Tax=Spongiactinospora sp. TRM90649 TaxID=3031114 RepID=UPI0023F9EED4|nr:hypothetical protein [Spongiactinospora sp. TRM90649]MDF5754159.1 hypothetical protein [Spongiactinospora sp. TRM90649]